MRHRSDANQTEIVEQCRKIGLSVAITSGVGDGFTDLVIGWRERNYLIELKDPNKPLSKRKLTPAQQEFHQTWKGQKAVAETIEDILKIVNE